MSGGSYNYAYHYVDSMADGMDDLYRRTLDPRQRRIPSFQVYDSANKRWLTEEESAPILAKVDATRAWFAKHLRLVAKAMRAVEWVDSSDYGPGDEVGPIEAVIGGGELKRANDEWKAVHDGLREAEAKLAEAQALHAEVGAARHQEAMYKAELRLRLEWEMRAKSAEAKLRALTETP